MDLFSLKEFTIETIKSLIENEVEENVHLDYKDGKALQTNDKGKNEITKDVSSFANSDGGIIVYGLTEKNIFQRTSLLLMVMLSQKSV